MNYLKVNNIQYKDFVENQGSNRLSKNLKLITDSKKGLLEKFGLVNELFDSEIKTIYSIEQKEKYTSYVFYSTSQNKYRLDIFPIDEKDKGLVYHIAFTLYDRNMLDYENPTNKQEMVEILGRIKFILKDINLHGRFCIGGTELQQKNNIYEYFLQIIVDNKIQKLTTKIYEVGWGLYFIL